MAPTSCASRTRWRCISATTAGSIRGCANWRSSRSYMTKQPYEYSHHVKLAMDFGCTEDDIRALADETAGKPSKLDPLSKLVLKAAREMTDDKAMSDATFAALRQHLDNDRLMELVIAIATYNGVIRILNTLQIDVEDSYKPYLEKFPLPAK